MTDTAPPTIYPLAGKTATVTGATRGIGRAVVLALANAGANVVVHGRDQARCDEVAAACEALPGPGKTATSLGDVRDAAAMTALVKTAVDEYGALDIAVSNAGIARDQLFLRMTEDDWDEVIAVNLKGAFLFAKACARQMRRQKHGRLIFMASLVGMKGNPGQANYPASKAGVIGLTKTLAKELLPYGVLVNAVAPGVIDTDLTSGYADDLREAGLKAMPMGRFGDPDEVTSAVLYFAGPGSTYTTGHILTIGGGIDL